MTEPAPLLRELSLRMSSGVVLIPDYLVLKMTPRLSVLRLTSCKINHRSSFFRGLTILSLSLPRKTSAQGLRIPSTQVLVTILRDSPLLKDLRLAYVGPPAPLDTPLDPKGDSIPLPCLEHLELADRVNVCMLVALHIQIPTQAFVRLDCGGLNEGSVCYSGAVDFFRKRCLSGAAEGNPLQTVEVAVTEEIVTFQSLFGVEDQHRDLPTSDWHNAYLRGSAYTLRKC